MAELCTVRQTAERAKTEGLGVTETALRSWIASGALAFVPVGNRRLIYWPTLLDFLAHGETVDNAPRPMYGRGSRGGKRR